MPSASARHILVETREQCEDLKKQIEGGAEFVDIAKQFYRKYARRRNWIPKNLVN